MGGYNELNSFNGFIEDTKISLNCSGNFTGMLKVILNVLVKLSSIVYKQVRDFIKM